MSNSLKENDYKLLHVCKITSLLCIVIILVNFCVSWEALGWGETSLYIHSYYVSLQGHECAWTCSHQWDLVALLLVVDWSLSSSWGLFITCFSSSSIAMLCSLVSLGDASFCSKVLYPLWGEHSLSAISTALGVAVYEQCLNKRNNFIVTHTQLMNTSSSDSPLEELDTLSVEFSPFFPSCLTRSVLNFSLHQTLSSSLFFVFVAFYWFCVMVVGNWMRKASVYYLMMTAAVAFWPALLSSLSSVFEPGKEPISFLL